MSTVADISRRLAAGESIADIALSGLPDGLRHAVMRCALVERFDERLYTEALAGAAGPGPAELLEEPSVEPLPGAAAGYRVLPEMREAAWRAWWTATGAAPDTAPVPADLRAAARDIARACERRGRTTEALRALVVADPALAAEKFTTWYRDRDEHLDLPGCQNLLDALTEPTRSRIVSPALAAVRNDHDRYLKSRTLWWDSLLKSAHYLPRPVLEERLDRLLEPGAATRAVRLQAMGGMGKSATLHWFISRRCVPRRVPCALLDLDALDTVKIARRPWLLVLEIAAQLDPQMAGSPFRELLREYQAYRPVLLRRASRQARAGAAALGRATAEGDGADIRSRFLTALAEDDPRRPLLIVLDTLEEAVLRPMGGARELVDVLRAIHDRAPQVRLVLSGRHTDAEARQIRSAQPGPCRPMDELTVPAFTDEEAARYLTELRGVREPRLVEAIVHRGEGKPWQLALYADVAAYSPDISAETVRRLDARLAWCLDRVIAPLGDSLQWLVRYGVLERRLGREVAEQVVLPRMVTAMRGCEDDRPEHDPRPPGAGPVFRTGPEVRPPEGPEDFAELWAALKRCTGEMSWVSAAPNDPDTLVLHPSVTEPLRRMLAAQPVYRLLHQDAARYYEALAERDPQDRADRTRAALYHRFRTDGHRAAPHWRQALEHAREHCSYEDLAEIAGEILGPDYVDEDGHPLTALDDVPMLDPVLHAEAHTELAWALARRARRQDLPAGHQLWSEIERSLDTARQIAARADTGPPARRWTAATAALLLGQGRPLAAEAVLGTGPADEDPPADRCLVLELRADVLHAAGRPGPAARALTAALAAAQEHGDTEAAADLTRRLAEAAAEANHYDEALARVRRAPREDLSATVATRLLLTEAGLALRLGRPARAARLADPGRDPAAGPDEDPDGRLLETAVRALLTLGRPRWAHALCDRALRTGAGLRPEGVARIRAERGRAAAELFRVEPALSDLLAARETFGRLQDYERAADCALAAAAVQLHVVGNLWDAEQYLDEAARFTRSATEPAAVRGRLLRAELADRRGEPAEAARQCAAALTLLEQSAADPRRVVRAAAQGVALTGRSEPFAVPLLRALRQVTPAAARLALLGPLDACPGPVDAGPDLLALVRDALPAEDGTDPLDEAWLRLRTATVLRLAGSEQACRTAEQAAAVLAEEDGFAWWTLARFLERTGPPGPREPLPPEPDGYDAYPMLRAAHLLTVTRHWMDASPAGGTVARLDRAAELLHRAAPAANRWQALLHELRARAAERAGGTAAAGHLRDAAVALRTELGDERTFPAGRQPAPETLGVDPAPDGGLLVHGGGRPLGAMPAAAPLARALARPGKLGPLVRALLDHRLYLPERSSLEPLLWAGAAAPVDICLTVGASRLAMVPWEIAVTRAGTLAADPRVRHLSRMPQSRRGDTARTGVLQAALDRIGVDPGPVDGLLGPETERAVTEAQAVLGLDPDGQAGSLTWDGLRSRLTEHRSAPRVLILRRGAGGQLESRRGHHMGGHDLAAMYTAGGWSVRLVDDPDPPLLQRLADSPDPPPHVLHLSATMDVLGSVPHLDFGSAGVGYGSSWEPSATGAIGVTDLGRYTTRLAGRGVVPLVVLDIAAPGRPSELVRQLLLRNDFAFQLATVGGAVVVLAAGLSRPGDERMTDTLVRLLAEGRTPAEVARALQRTADGDPLDAPLDQLPYAATALMSSLAPDAMLPVGV